MPETLIVILGVYILIQAVRARDVDLADLLAWTLYTSMLLLQLLRLYGAGIFLMMMILLSLSAKNLCFETSDSGNSDIRLLVQRIPFALFRFLLQKMVKKRATGSTTSIPTPMSAFAGVPIASFLTPGSFVCDEADRAGLLADQSVTRIFLLTKPRFVHNSS